MAYGLNSHVDMGRPAAGGATLAETWLLDRFFLLLMDRALINGAMSNTPPGDNTKLWLDTSAGTAFPASWKKWSGSAWVAVSGTDVVAHIVARGLAGGSVVVANSPLTGNGTGGSPLDVDFSALGAGDTQAIATKIAGDAVALETVKDALMADLDTNDAQAIATKIAGDATALETVKDALMADLDMNDVRSIVNAIQADVTALADLVSSVPSGSGFAASGDNTAGYDLGSTNGHFLVYVNDLVLSGASFSVQLSRDGGTTWQNTGSSASAANGVKFFLPLTVVCGAGAGAWNHVLNSVSSSENSSNTFSLSNGAFNGAETANNVRIRFTNTTSVGSVRYVKVN